MSADRKEYMREYSRKWRARKSPDYGAEKARRWRDAHPDHNMKKYGLTLEGFNALLTAQGGRCAVCRGEPNGSGRFHIDHDHITGKVRGLLCMSCNLAIGYFKDDPERIQAAIDYLRRTA